MSANRSLVVPVGNPGASVDVSMFDASSRQLVINGLLAGEVLSIEGSDNNVDFEPIGNVFGNGTQPITQRNTFLRSRTASATATIQVVGLETTTPSTSAAWQQQNSPGAAADATFTRAAGAAGVRHFVTGLQCALVTAAAAQVVADIQILDGATIVWAQSIAAPVNALATYQIAFAQPIMGSAATALTVRTNGIAAAGAFARIAAQGYDL